MIVEHTKGEIDNRGIRGGTKDLHGYFLAPPGVFIEAGEFLILVLDGGWTAKVLTDGAAGNMHEDTIVDFGVDGDVVQPGDSNGMQSGN